MIVSVMTSATAVMMSVAPILAAAWSATEARWKLQDHYRVSSVSSHAEVKPHRLSNVVGFGVVLQDCLDCISTLRANR
jgi:hypothetical protein